MAFAILASALCIATFLPMGLLAVGLPSPAFEKFVFRTSGPFCHQLPDRSFQVADHVFPICVRCTGMWIGITLGVALAMAWVPRRRWLMGVSLAVAMFAASGLEHIRELSGGAQWPWARFIFGLFLFLGVTVAVSFDTLAVLSAGVRALRRTFER